MWFEVFSGPFPPSPDHSDQHWPGCMPCTRDPSFGMRAQSLSPAAPDGAATSITSLGPRPTSLHQVTLPSLMGLQICNVIIITHFVQLKTLKTMTFKKGSQLVSTGSVV